MASLLWRIAGCGILTLNTPCMTFTQIRKHNWDGEEGRGLMPVVWCLVLALGSWGGTFIGRQYIGYWKQKEFLSYCLQWWHYLEMKRNCCNNSYFVSVFSTVFWFTNPPRCWVYQLKKSHILFLTFFICIYPFKLPSLFLMWHWKPPVL